MKLILPTAFVTVVLCLSICNANAQVFKCKSATGKVEFSDAGCDGVKSTEKLNIYSGTNSVDASSSRELLLRKENEELKSRLQEQRQITNTAPQRTQADLQADRIDTYVCERARRDYRVSSSSTSNNANYLESLRIAMYGACGMHEPNRTTVIQNTIVR